jgi:ATP-binding cassette, subfamily B, bacterial
MQGSEKTELVQPQDLNVRREPAPLEPLQAKSSDQLERLSVRALRYIHPESGRGLEEASFDLRRGEFVVITGRIGSGKTTLLRALLGLLPAQNFDMRWNNQIVSNPAEFMTPPRTAYTPQVPNLISGSVRDNIELGVGDHLDRAIKRAVLERDLEHLPQGLDTLVGVRGLKLSGGQLQRTAAARMFAQNPSLLVFDDISSALDVNTERELWARLEPNTTCLVVSHRKAALERADRIVLLEHGRVTHTGKLSELLKTSSEMRAIWGGEVEA